MMYCATLMIYCEIAIFENNKLKPKTVNYVNFKKENIDFNTYEKEEELNDAFGAGRGYAVASGVAGAIKACIDEYYPGTEVKIDHVEGLADCSLCIKGGSLQLMH